MNIHRLILTIISAVFLSACVHSDGYYTSDGRYVKGNLYNKKGVPVVSASRGSDEYISREAVGYTEYVSALDAAKKEQMRAQSVSPIDEYVASLSNEALREEVSQVSYENLEKSNLSSIWGKPTGSVGEGLTLMNKSLRKRFNDALSTTPVGSQARWRFDDRSFIFMPNSDVYQPYFSGGNCRDGVFINYQGGREEKIRGLFCQKGRGAD